VDITIPLTAPSRTVRTVSSSIVERWKRASMIFAIWARVFEVAMCWIGNRSTWGTEAEVRTGHPAHEDDKCRHSCGAAKAAPFQPHSSQQKA
jgi:hypothetical protein